jgi:DNA-binding beta-propeller fold protein YncE
MFDLDNETLVSGINTPWAADLAMHPSGTRLFASGEASLGGCYIWAIDTASLQIVGIHSSALECTFDMAVQSNGGALLGGPRIVFATPVSPHAYTADAQMLPLSTSPWPGTWIPHRTRTGPSGTFFTADRTLDDLLGFSPQSSRLSFVSWFSAAPITLVDLPLGNAIVDFVSNPLGTLLYVGFNNGLLVINTNPGQVVAGVPNVGDASIAIHPLGSAVYVVDGQFNAISTTTLGVIASEPFGTEGVAVKP